MNLLPEKPSPTVLATRPPAAERAVLSLVMPGLGQFAQRRFLAGAAQLGTVVAYATGALVFGDARALIVAVVWNVWSAIDAYRNERS